MNLWRMIKSGIKGSIMVAIGLWVTSIGIGRLITNLVFGPLAFFFIAISGSIVFETLRISEDESSKILKGLIVFGAMFITGCSLTIYNMLCYNLDFLVMVFVTVTGLIWFFLSYYGVQSKIGNYIEEIIISLAFTLGIFYGALLNYYIIPIYIYFFFLTAIFLQLSRELVKKFNDRESEEENSNYETIKIALTFQIIALIFFILPLVTTISNLILYLYIMLIGLIFIGLAIFLTVKSVLETRKIKKIGLLLKIGILIELIAFTLAN
ncbi:MAG: hypothetical protein HWN65_15290 [Candidatus Helarchaeota archaeon]|nr:hypothetical protein [Candidatus Helarchaeota archaeon]